MQNDLVKRLRARAENLRMFLEGYTALDVEEAADRIEQLEAALQYATEYAGRLASTLAEKHYPEVQVFKLLPSLLGRIDQIDNLTCGMTRALMEGKDD